MNKFIFIAPANGNVTFRTVGSADTRGILYDSKGNVLASNDDTSATNLNFSITYNITAGEVYIISVFGKTFEYICSG